MSLTIEVYRGAGDRQGPDITDPLIGDSLPAALARGRAELDAAAQPTERVEILLGFRPQSRCGELIAVSDPVLGASWRGKVIGCSHVLSGPELLTTLTVERPV